MNLRGWSGVGFLPGLVGLACVAQPGVGAVPCPEGEYLVGDQCVGECGVEVTGTCSAAMHQEACEANGGQWWGMPPSRCICPTSDYGCLCEHDDQCDGRCVADADLTSCEQAVTGTCSRLDDPKGCICVFWDGNPTGAPTYVCFD